MSNTCKPLNCRLPDDLASCPAIYATAPISVLQDCPPNSYCPPGLFPQVMTFQIADIPAVVACNFSDNSPILLALQGCLGIISRTLPAGSPFSDIEAAAHSMQAEWVGQEAQCIALQEAGVKPLLFTNDEQVFLCPGGGNPTSHTPINPESKVFGGLGQSITLMVVNATDNVILGADFKMFFSNGGEVDGVVNIPAHTTMQEWNSVGGSPLLSWFITYQGTVIFSNPNNTNVVTCTVVFSAPFTGGGGVVISNSRVVVPAGTFSADTKAQANALALAALNRTVAAALAAGTLTCPV